MDIPTAAIAVVSLAILLLARIPEPVLVAAAGAAGLAIWVLAGRGG